MTDEIINPPDVITPLESSYIRAALPAILPAVNFLIDATNLDVALHITKLTTDQLWKGFNALLVAYSVGAMIFKRIRDGNDPNSTARKIVFRKPPDPPPDEFQHIVDTMQPPEVIHTISEMPPQKPISAEEAMKEIDEYAESLKKKP